MSELRKAIKSLQVLSLDGTQTSSVVLLSDQAVDAILDAVIAALPEGTLIPTSDKSRFSDAAYYGTRSRYQTIEEIKSLLESAKDNK